MNRGLYMNPILIGQHGTTKIYAKLGEVDAIEDAEENKGSIALHNGKTIVISRFSPEFKQWYTNS